MRASPQTVTVMSSVCGFDNTHRPGLQRRARRQTDFSVPTDCKLSTTSHRGCFSGKRVARCDNDSADPPFRYCADLDRLDWSQLLQTRPNDRVFSHRSLQT